MGGKIGTGRGGGTGAVKDLGRHLAKSPITNYTRFEWIKAELSKGTVQLMGRCKRDHVQLCPRDTPIGSMGLRILRLLQIQAILASI